MCESEEEEAAETIHDAVRRMLISGGFATESDVSRLKHRIVGKPAIASVLCRQKAKKNKRTRHDERKRKLNTQTRERSTHTSATTHSQCSVWGCCRTTRTQTPQQRTEELVHMAELEEIGGCVESVKEYHLRCELVVHAPAQPAVLRTRAHSEWNGRTAATPHHRRAVKISSRNGHRTAAIR